MGVMDWFRSRKVSDEPEVVFEESPRRNNQQLTEHELIMLHDVQTCPDCMSVNMEWHHVSDFTEKLWHLMFHCKDCGQQFWTSRDQSSGARGKIVK